MKRNQFFLFGSRDIFSPLLIYYVVIMVAMYAAGFFVGPGDEWYNLRKIIGAIITIPFCCRYCRDISAIIFYNERKCKKLQRKSDKTCRLHSNQ